MQTAGRPCRYCLGLQDDSVFADFDLDNKGRIFLLRISFDGYGCCTTAKDVRPMSPDISNRLIHLVEANNFGSGELAAILSQYFRENSDVIWLDALEAHNLLQG